MSQVKNDPKKRVRVICQNLAFLGEKYEFKPFQLSEEIVRLENRRIFITIHHAEPGLGIGLRFGPLKAPGQSQNVFDAEDLVEMVEPEYQMPYREYPVKEWEDLEAVMQGWANFLLTVGIDILRADREMFDKLALRRREKALSDASEDAAALLDKAEAKVTVRDGLTAMSETSVRRSTIPSVEIDASAVLEKAEKVTQKALEISMDPDRFDEWQSMINAMEPHPLDFQAVFGYQVAEEAAGIYKNLWNQGIVAPTPQPGHTMVRVAGCYSEWLRTDSRTSRRFPPEYRRIAHLLEPGVIWMVWKYMGHGRTKAATYDGLVYLEKHWAWLPSPHVHLAHHGKDEP
jgi:hypothetical protein